MTISAPGKLMLFGEHAVVYGYPCIVTALSERLEVAISETDDLPDDHRFVDAAIHAWGGGRDILLSVKCAFSGCYGFGSSSAVTVATLKALKPDADARRVFDAAYKIVLDIQGAGSGFDVAAATYGGTLYFVKGGKVIEPLPVTDMPLIVGYTGVKADTKTLISDVAGKHAKEPEKVERIFGAIGKIVDDAKAQIVEGDWERVGRLMDFNQEYLRDLGASSEKLEALIKAAKTAGAYGAKLSGAGRGDCMIALAPADKREKVEEAITRAGGEVVHVTPNAPGVRIETTDDQQELFIVVDKDDNVLGYKTRYECHHDKTLIHRTVGTAVFNSKGEILLLKRSKTKDLGAGLWDVSIGGHVNKNESYEDAAKREMMEEVGIDSPLVFHSKKIFSNTEETEMQALFTTTYDGPFKMNQEEIEDSMLIQPNLMPRKLLSREIALSTWAENDLKKLHIL
jgi:mevalonate kinase